MNPILRFENTSYMNENVLNMIHISDIHFGVINPKVEYDILVEQVINVIEPLNFRIFCINGDLFDKKFMSNTEPILYASLFVSLIVEMCKRKNATLIIIDGTESHDSGQLKIFYHYLNDPYIDIRIVEKIKFEYVDDMKILCIPELYNIKEDVYRHFLFYSGLYDLCFMHGRMEGAIYNSKTDQSRLFTIKDFCNCKGPIISGHVHIAGCFSSYFYYTGSPIRWCFGEENEKGFLIVLYDKLTRQHYTYLQEVKSFRYDTINADELVDKDPKTIIDYVDNLHKNGVDNIRLEFTKTIPADNLTILNNYFRKVNYVKLKIIDTITKKIERSKSQEEKELYEQYSYLYDNKLTEYEKLSRFIMDKENIYIGADIIKEMVMNNDL